MPYDDLPLHTSAEKFAEEKRKCQTSVRNSPPRYAGRHPDSHPYEQTGELDYSLERFDTKKRVHNTHIKNSPQRSRSVDDRRRPPSPMTFNQQSVSPNRHGANRHVSQRTFALEKSEHFAEVLPRRANGPPEPRVLSAYRHGSQAELAKEISLCKTPLCPVPAPSAKAQPPVVDNYLNYTPHGADFLHHSCKTLNREKRGHLTEMNIARKLRDCRGPSATPVPQHSPARFGLYTSGADLRHHKKRCATQLSHSNHRSKSADGVPDLSPQYLSNRRFTHDKNRCTTDIHVSPRMGRAPTPEKGYSSYDEYRQDKRVHRATASPARNPVQPRSVSASPMRDYPGHTSHARYHDEKRLHKTGCYTPQRNRAPSAEAPRSKSPAGHTSRRELETAKQKHKLAFGGVVSPDLSQQRRIHQSNMTFSSEKRAHRTAVGNIHTPPSHALSPPGSEARGYTSIQRFSENKSKHRVDTSPMRGAYRDEPSPAYSPLTSNQALQFQKNRHRLEMDSPNRARVPQTPPSVGRADDAREAGRLSFSGRMARTPDNQSVVSASERSAASRRSRSIDHQTPARDVPAGLRSPAADAHSYASTDPSYYHAA
eukprot:TRINITY_DN9555_c0_g1_i3.p1 TRINITY_DN9555_c0_g1~~TRINITY_DN9555_c0_g1_i3.p1  ORF type:complete len:596 (+),score=205.18 TRINITY_DN9555_c0_g1_i3:69-1856(+)